MQSTQLIVLRKTPYQESSLIIAGLSPEFGRLDFVVKGARRVGAKQFPVIDLFRELQIEFKNRGKALQGLGKAELLRNCDAIASSPENYVAASRLGAFLLKNSHPMLPCPKSYGATRNALLHYAEGATLIPWDSLTQLVFLAENGLFHEGDEAPAQKALLSSLLAAACGEAPLPSDIRADYWPRFTEWVQKLCHCHELQGERTARN